MLYFYVIFEFGCHQSIRAITILKGMVKTRMEARVDRVEKEPGEVRERIGNLDANMVSLKENIRPPNMN